MRMSEGDEFCAVKGKAQDEATVATTAAISRLGFICATQLGYQIENITCPAPEDGQFPKYRDYPPANLTIECPRACV